MLERTSVGSPSSGTSRPRRARGGGVLAAAAALLMTAALLMSCGEPPAVVTADPSPAPERTAAQDQALRALVMDLAEAHTCETLRDRFLPLPEDRPARPVGERPVADGRLWVSECRVERSGARLEVHLAGRGWQWVERSRPGPLGSSFTVRGTVRFEASVDFSGEVDLRYDEENHLASIVLTPGPDLRARVTPIGAVPVTPDGGWSGLIGGLGGLLGGSPEQQARPLLEQEAGAILRRELGRGLTLTLDLCSSQVDASIGPVADGAAPAAPPYDGEGELWLDNMRTRLHAGGLELAGPFSVDDPDGQLAIDVELESAQPGESAQVDLVCASEAALLASAFLAGGEAQVAARIVRGQASSSRPLALSARLGGCERAVLVLGTTSETATVRYRVRDGSSASALVRCAP